MNPVLVAIVFAICAGAVVAVSARDPGAASIGLTIALVAAALLVEPLPSAAILGVRVVAALLVATIIRSAVRGGQRQPSPLGWPAEALLATAGAIAGLGVAVGLAAVAAAAGVPVGVPGAPAPGGPEITGGGTLTSMAITVAAGSSLLALGTAPLIHGQPGVRRAIGLVLVTQAVLLIRVGIAGPGVDLEEITRAALLVTAAATGAALARAATLARATEEADVDVREGRRPVPIR